MTEATIQTPDEFLAQAREHGRIVRWRIVRPQGAQKMHHVVTVHDDGFEQVVAAAWTIEAAREAKGIVRTRVRIVNNTIHLDAYHRTFADRPLSRREKAQALVDEGLADDLADARAQLEDMGE